MMKSKFAMLIMLAFGMSASYAETPHTWHTISAKSGTWNGSLRMIHEKGHFVNRNGADLNNFTVSPDVSQDYGFVLDQSDDFDVAYTVTLTQEDSKKMSLFKSKACVYVVTAKGPGLPDINVTSYHGANCSYNDPDHIGVNFIVG